MTTTLTEFLERRLKLSGEEVNGWYRACCPFHGERRPSFGVELTSPYRYNCFACSAGGDIVTLVMKLLAVSEIKARRLLLPTQLNFQSSDREFEVEFMPLDPAVLPFYQSQLLRKRPRRYLLGRGFSPELAAAFGLGYDLKRKSLVMPLREPFSDAVEGLFFRGVAGSFKHLEGPKRRLVFASPNYRRTDTVIVTEGWADAMRLYQWRRLLGIPSAAVMSIQQARVTAHVSRFLADYAAIYWALDNDAAGLRGLEKSATGKQRQFLVEFDGKDAAQSSEFKVRRLGGIDVPALPSQYR